MANIGQHIKTLRAWGLLPYIVFSLLSAASTIAGYKSNPSYVTITGSIGAAGSTILVIHEKRKTDCQSRDLGRFNSYPINIHDETHIRIRSILRRFSEYLQFPFSWRPINAIRFPIMALDPYEVAEMGASSSINPNTQFFSSSPARPRFPAPSSSSSSPLVSSSAAGNSPSSTNLPFAFSFSFLFSNFDSCTFGFSFESPFFSFHHRPATHAPSAPLNSSSFNINPQSESEISLLSIPSRADLTVFPDYNVSPTLLLS
ncbi:hypothetical protein GYMLUDRAFT_824166 [Collybiopsis luxurians FD-317 M1]|uniref:Uncharacterized protein n=1 Tax=Collybiopsis luxurians FD-317 M1 TaxID=944289 RepID=A0A0D0CDF5_9AGAR|nr:hypothetical protein GYMLUDRAFT_824166 [Collybiopsis luxurians FD-317 M1]